MFTRSSRSGPFFGVNDLPEAHRFCPKNDRFGPSSLVPLPVAPVLPILAAFSRHKEALQRGRLGGRVLWTVALASPRFEFRETDYYTATMGP